MIKQYTYCWIFILFLSGKLALSSDPEGWMKRLGDDAQVSRITIPGSHDTCALHGMLWGQCQSLTLEEQLKAGVRFLDIRCKLIDGQLKIYHGIIDQKTTFPKVVTACETFLKAQPSETILMSIMDEGSPDIKPGEFGKAIGAVTALNSELWINSKKPPTLGDVRGRIVIVSRNREVKGLPWKGFRIQDSFRLDGRDAISAKWKKFESHANSAAKSEKDWYINFASGTGVFYPPQNVANEINQSLDKHFKKKPATYQGIVVMDFVTPSLIKAVYTSNF